MSIKYPSIYYCGPATMGFQKEFHETTIDQIIAHIYKSGAEFIQLDLETQGQDPHIKKIITVQLGIKGFQAVIDVRHHDVLKLKKLLEDKQFTFLGHNLKFDYQFLKKAGIICDKVYDTFLAEMVIWNGFSKVGYGLDKVVNRYLNVDMDKAVRTEIWKVGDKELNVEQIIYAATDVMYLEDIMDKQLEKIKQNKISYAVDLENAVMPAIADMEFYGVRLDVEAWNKNAEANEEILRSKTLELEAWLAEEPSIRKDRRIGIQNMLFGHNEVLIKAGKEPKPFNPGSPQQIKLLLQLIYSKERFDSDASTGDETLQYLKKKYPKIPFAFLLEAWREYSKAVSTYGKEMARKSVKPYDGRIHTNFRQIVSTFRMSSGDGKDDSKPNMQNIPHTNNYRNCFIPREGFSWLSADYSGQELRIMADGSQENGFIDILNKGEDLHCYVGSMMTGKVITKEDKEERSAAKSINFMVPYGGGPQKLSGMIDKPMKEAASLLDKHAKAFPKLHAWLNKNGNFASRFGFIRLPYPHGGIRWMPEILEINRNPNNFQYNEVRKRQSAAEREGKNTPIQGLGAVIMKDALLHIRKYFIESGHYEKNAYLILTVHDQADIEVRKGFEEEIKNKVVEIMEASGNKYVKSVYMAVDATITDKWQK